MNHDNNSPEEKKLELLLKSQPIKAEGDFAKKVFSRLNEESSDDVVIDQLFRRDAIKASPGFTEKVRNSVFPEQKRRPLSNFLRSPLAVAAAVACVFAIVIGGQMRPVVQNGVQPAASPVDLNSGISGTTENLVSPSTIVMDDVFALAETLNGADVFLAANYSDWDFYVY